VGDGLLLVAAWLIYGQAARPMTPYEVGAFGLCVGFGAWLGVWPFVLRQRGELKLAETAELRDTLAQIERVEDVGARIQQATSQWQSVHEHATRASAAAREVAERMTAETKEFFAFMEKANDAERNHLRLEVEKLRRTEGDWLGVTVRMLDHVYALFLAAVRSGQPGLTEQIGRFQEACRDVVRRVGLAPVVPQLNSPFDPAVCEPPEAGAAVPGGATVGQVLACGYSFQGQLIRRALVSPQAPAPADGPAPSQAPTAERPSSPRGEAAASAEAGGHSPQPETDAPAPARGGESPAGSAGTQAQLSL